MAFWAPVKNVGWSHFLLFGAKQIKIFLIMKQGSDSSTQSIYNSNRERVVLIS